MGSITERAAGAGSVPEAAELLPVTGSVPETAEPTVAAGSEPVVVAEPTAAAEPGERQRPRGGGLRARLRLWAKYAAGSVVATILSQIAFTLCYGALDTSAAVASVLAFFAGAIPNYLLNKAWAWNDRSVPRRRAALTYLAVIGVTNGLAIAVTTLTDSWVRTHVASHGARTLLVDLAYLASYGVMFVVKFLLFDALVFKSRSAREHAPHSAK